VRGRVLEDISFTVGEGDCVIVGGANGSGKSLLMSHIAGLTSPTAGTILLKGKPISAKGTSGRVGLIFQEADSQILGETCREDVEFGLKNLKVPRIDRRLMADACLEKTGLAGKEESPARFLSGGEKRRLAVAGVLAMNPELIIFDEPFANLDWPGVQQVCSIIEMLKREGKTLIILTHELEKVLGQGNRFLVLHQGKLVFDGAPKEGLSQPLEEWGIRNPLQAYTSVEDLTWMA
jgi:biotin transport system ATP-binding protein